MTSWWRHNWEAGWGGGLLGRPGEAGPSSQATFKLLLRDTWRETKRFQGGPHIMGILEPSGFWFLSRYLSQWVMGVRRQVSGTWVTLFIRYWYLQMNMLLSFIGKFHWVSCHLIKQPEKVTAVPESCLLAPVTHSHKIENDGKWNAIILFQHLFFYFSRL
jgi:hypothetical protein